MRCLLSILCFLLLCHQLKAEDPTNSLLNVLKAEILKKPAYDKIKNQAINNLKHQLATSPKDDYSALFAAANKLYDAYEGYIFDSAYAIALHCWN